MKNLLDYLKELYAHLPQKEKKLCAITITLLKDTEATNNLDYRALITRSYAGVGIQEP